MRFTLSLSSNTTMKPLRNKKVVFIGTTSICSPFSPLPFLAFSYQLVFKHHICSQKYLIREPYVSRKIVAMLRKCEHDLRPLYSHQYRSFRRKLYRWKFTIFTPLTTSAGPISNVNITSGIESHGGYVGNLTECVECLALRVDNLPCVSTF